MSFLRKNDESLWKVDEPWKIIIWRLSKWFFEQQSLNKKWWSVVIWEVFIGKKHDGQKHKHIKYRIPKKWDKICIWIKLLLDVHRYIPSPCSYHCIPKDRVWSHTSLHLFLSKVWWFRLVFYFKRFFSWKGGTPSRICPAVWVVRQPVIKQLVDMSEQIQPFYPVFRVTST